MSILFFTVGPEIMAGSRTRVYQYLPHLKMQGVNCKVINYHSAFFIKQGIRQKSSHIKKGFLSRLNNFIQLLKLLYFVLSAPFFDVIFVQKLILPRKLRKILQKLDKVMVLDFDDSTFFLNNDAHELADIFTSASLIIVENEYNKRYAQEYCDNILTITGPIDTDRYQPLKSRNFLEKKVIVAGWIGHPQHADYLMSLEPVFKELASRYPQLKVMAIGAGDSYLHGVEFDNREWSLESEVEDLRKFDIGLMPLFKDQVAEGKGGYKLLQYMAMGIPSVASPVGINTRLIREGENGFLASSHQEWVDKISLLIENRDLREQMGEKAREMALKRYSFQVAAPRLMDALNSITDRLQQPTINS